jgi:EPS-associated MarR family transcriptional regulator
VNTDKEEYLKLLRKIGNDPEISQRDLSSELDMSLGKINYCLKALKSKGLIKIKNFGKSTDKIKYLYVLTPKGLVEKTNITIRFMKLKMKEYDELKKELLKQKSANRLKK